jgi:outer membrane protein OmpA-like peptidoglycan-associated protein
VSEHGAATKRATAPSTPVHGGILQRTCACGQHTPAGSTCPACAKGRQRLQRKAIDRSGPASVPPSVDEVLRSAGRSLDPATRAFMEPRFGHAFSHVRVHTDAKAAESAGAVNALAYTVGPDIVFGTGQYAPRTNQGRSLLAHELVHVIQQRDSHTIPGRLAIGTSNDAREQEAGSIAQVVTDHPTSFVTSALRSGPVLQRVCGKDIKAPVWDCLPDDSDPKGETFLFNVNCDDLKPGEADHVKELVAGLKPGTPGHSIKIHGFASMDGPRNFNWLLSCQRAYKMRELISDELPPLKGGDIPLINGTPQVFKHGPTSGPADSRRSVIVEGVTIPPPAPSPPVPRHKPGQCTPPSNANLWGRQFNPTTDSEAWVAVHLPFEALEVLHARDLARADASASGLPGQHLGPRDAFRHCVWNCYMARAITDTDAEKFATGHENSGPSTMPWNNEMDLHNNAMGRTLSYQGPDCAEYCKNAVKTGQLRTIRGPEANRTAAREGLSPSTPPVPKTCIGASDQPWP